MLKIRTSPLEERKTTPMNAIQVQINENIRMLAILKDIWAREKEEEERVKSLPTHTTLATLHVVEDLKTFSTHHIPSPPNRPINGDANTSTLGQDHPLNLETTKEKMSLDDITPTLINGSELYFDNCSLFEVIKFLQRMEKDPHTSSLNISFTEHITNALMKAREEKLKLEVSIPRKLEDGWYPMVKIKLNNFSYFALCDVGASASVLPKRMYDMLELKPFDPCFSCSSC